MIKSMNIAWWVQRWSELTPDKTAIIFEDQTISYKALCTRADRTSCWLQSIGIEKGDRVAVMLNNCPEFIDLFLACSRLGAIFVPINFRITSVELDYFIKNCRPRLFVHGEDVAGVVNALVLESYLPPMMVSVVGTTRLKGRVFDFVEESKIFDGKRPFLTRSLGPANPEEPQVIMYTSGTTGKPKGAVLTHRKTFFNCLNADIFFKLHSSDIMLIFLPLFHSGGLFIQAAPIFYKGATIVLHRKFDSLKVYRDIETYQVTKFLGVPTVYKELLKVEPEMRGDTSSLRVCAGGGEKLTDDLIKKCAQAGLAFRQILGQTETSILLWASEDDPLKKPGTVGRPVFHAEVSIIDDRGRVAKPGEVGEIVVRGSIMMKEYWQDPVKTEETIKNGYLHTGDLARMDEDGFFYLVGRAGDMYISGGENVYPAEVEKILKLHSDIEDVAVKGMPDETWGETGHAFVILSPGASLSQEDVIALCHGKLAKYKWPKKVTFKSEFPRTSLGKIRKGALS
ncbi:AMP-binding protein [Desulfobacula sp.]|uniref:class I adenylate-forming enzyme family protein n=1 Tax=Desulfobacula sp. TaxID=2593537 RepID=UPI002612CF1C|nr:AMP-binding protein [Desulfobacula sp.]